MIKSQLKMQRQNKEKIRISIFIQDTIPVDTVFSDDIFRMKNRFSKTYRFLAIDFSIASDESKEFIIKMYKELMLNNESKFIMNSIHVFIIVLMNIVSPNISPSSLPLKTVLCICLLTLLIRVCYINIFPHFL